MINTQKVENYHYRPLEGESVEMAAVDRDPSRQNQERCPKSTTNSISTNLSAGEADIVLTNCCAYPFFLPLSFSFNSHTHCLSVCLSTFSLSIFLLRGC